MSTNQNSDGGPALDLVTPGPGRRWAAVGGLLCGDLSFADAAALAGVSMAELAGDVARATAEHGVAAERRQRPVLSVVLPVYNEADNVAGVVERLHRVLADLESYELIFVNDGSSDATQKTLVQLHAADERTKVVELSRNFGHQNALTAGLQLATGSGVVLMDADGQDPPELLPQFVERWREGYEVVYGVRQQRKEAAWKRVGYSLFYRALYRIAEMPIPPNAGDFCLMDRRVVDALNDIPEVGKFLRGLRSWVGFRQVGVPYDRPARVGGDSKYSFSRLVRLALDGLLSFSSVPLRLASLLGFVTSFLGMLYLAFALVGRLFRGHVPAGWTSVIAIVLLIGGAQLIVIGVLGEYLARVFAEVKRRPVYVIASRHW